MRKLALLIAAITTLNIAAIAQGNGNGNGQGGPPGWKLNGNNNADSTSFIGTSNNTDLILKTNDQERMRTTSDGKVGIGTSNPSEKLDVNGNVKLRGNTDISGDFKIESLSDTTTGFRLLYIDENGRTRAGEKIKRGKDPVVFYCPKALPWVAKESVNNPFLEDIYLCQNYNYVGIGTANPQYTFDVQGQINATSYFINGNPLPLSKWSATASNIFYSGGGVGIGTDIPKERLNVKDGIIRIDNYGKNTRIGSLSSDWSHFMTTADNFYFEKPIHVNGSIGSYGTKDLMLHTGSTRRITISNSTGNVGIGISSPAEKLHLNGNAIFQGSHGQILLKSTGSGSRWALQSHSGSGSLNFRHNTTDSYFGDVKVTFSSNGNVGIGTGSPDHLLHIESYNARLKVGSSSKHITLGYDGGNTIIESQSTLVINHTSNHGVSIGGTLRACKEISVSNNSWCDYVFDKNYNRMTFEEREEYYKENKHLYGIRKGEDIEQNGLPISETMTGMVLNLEELSLNQIDLYKMIKLQQEEIKQLKQELESLKK